MRHQVTYPLPSYLGANLPSHVRHNFLHDTSYTSHSLMYTYHLALARHYFHNSEVRECH